MKAFDRIINCGAEMSKLFAQTGLYHANSLINAAKETRGLTGTLTSQMQWQAVGFGLLAISSGILGVAGKTITANANGMPPATPTLSDSALQKLGEVFGDIDPKVAQTFCKTASKGLDQFQNVGNLLGTSVTKQTETKLSLQQQVVVSGEQQGLSGAHQDIRKLDDLLLQIVQANTKT